MKKNGFVSRRPQLVAVGLLVAVSAGYQGCQSRKNNLGTTANIANRQKQGDFYKKNDTLPRGYDALSAKEKQDVLWKKISAERPAGKPMRPKRAVEQGARARDLVDNLRFAARSTQSIAERSINTLRDEYPKNVVDTFFNSGRVTHRVGVAAKVSYEPVKGNKYSGLFTGAKYGIARMSLASNPYHSKRFNRSVAIKWLVDGSYSRSMYAMFRIFGNDPVDEVNGSNQHQNWNYFNTNFPLTNILQDPAKGGETQVANKFSAVVRDMFQKAGREPRTDEDFFMMSSWLSVDNMAWHTADGTAVERSKVKAPHRIALVPNPEMEAALSAAGADEADQGELKDVMAKALAGKTGRVLWAVHATDSKTMTRDQLAQDKSTHIGNIVLQSGIEANDYLNSTFLVKHWPANVHEFDDVEAHFRTGARLSTQPLPNREANALRASLDDPTLLSSTLPSKGAECKTVANSPISDQSVPLQRSKVSELYDVVLSDHAPFCLEYRNTTRGFPEELQGVWWMDGNPLPDELVTFANASWDGLSKTLSLPIHEPGNWTWYASKLAGSDNPDGRGNPLNRRGAGLTLHSLTATSNTTYEIKWDPKMGKDFETGVVPKLFGLSIPKSAANFTIKLENEEALGDESHGIQDYGSVPLVDVLKRNRSAFVQIPFTQRYVIDPKKGYNFRKLIDAQGNVVEENYKLYLEDIKKRQLVYQLIFRGKQ